MSTTLSPRIIQPSEYKQIPMPTNPSPVETWWYQGLAHGWIGKIGDTYVAIDRGCLYPVHVPAPEFVLEFEKARESQVITIYEPAQ